MTTMAGDATIAAREGAAVLPGHLPATFTSFVGRERERQEVAALLGRARLVTLTGAGGVGKTRLALAVATELLTAYPDGFCVVELAPVADPALVASTIAQALKVREAGSRPLEGQLVAHLRDRRLLLVLDNCEHLRDACAALLATLLAGCPGLRVLATSRAPLRLRWERRFAVPPLALPGEDAAGIEAVAAAPAVALFVARAQAVEPLFALDAGNAGTVAAICRRLNGLPLTLELAAARLKGHSPAALLAELDDQLRALGGGSRRHEARQRTLHALLDWSYTLLGPGEQALFARLAVFAGSWTVEAATAVCVLDDDLPFPVAEGLASLVEQSLVQGPDAMGRYRMLEPVRAYARYALGRLAAAEDERRVRRRHAEYYLALAEEVESQQAGTEQGAWLALLEREHDNVRAALAWSLEDHSLAGGGARDAPSQPPREPLEVGMRLASAIWRFWLIRGHVTEGRAWLGRLLARSLTSVAHERAGMIRAKMLAATAALATEQGDHAQAASLAEEALALYRATGDQRRVAVVLNILGATWMRLGDYVRALALYEESLATFRALAIPQSIATVLNNLGTLARYQREYARAAALYEESLAIKHSLEDTLGIATSLNNLGEVALDQGDLDRAAHLFEQSLARFREQEGQWNIALLFTNLGDVARARGDHVRAASLYRQSLTLYRDQHNYQDVGECLDGIAAVCCALGDPHRAARLLAATTVLRASLGMPMPPAERVGYDDTVAAVRAAIGEEGFARAWAEGQALSPEAVIEHALAWEPPAGYQA